MADRKQFLTTTQIDPELERLLEATRDVRMTPEQLQEQSISFAYGNAMNNPSITKETVRRTAQNLWLYK